MKVKDEAMEKFGYRSLIVWQKAMLLVRLVYAEVKKLPNDERYALGDQIRRSVVSIPSNIAEGNGRTSNKDYAHFLATEIGRILGSMLKNMVPFINSNLHLIPSRSLWN